MDFTVVVVVGDTVDELVDCHDDVQALDVVRKKEDEGLSLGVVSSLEDEEDVEEDDSADDVGAASAEMVDWKNCPPLLPPRPDQL